MRYFLKCPRCDNPIAENQKFCTKCGINFEMEFKKNYPPDFVSKYELIFKEIELKGENDNLYAELAQMFFEKEKYKEAIFYFEKALSLNDKNYQATLGAGISYLKINHIPKAQFLLHKALELNPHSIQAIEGLFYIYAMDEKNYPAALELAQKIYKQKSSDLNFLETVKKIYLSLHQYENARKSIEIILSLKPEENKLKYLLKELLYINIKMQDYSYAAKIAENLYDVKDDPVISIYKTFSFLKVSEFDKAINSFKNIEPYIFSVVEPELIEMLTDSLFEISNFYFSQGNLKAAKKFANYLVKLKSNPETKQLLAKILLYESLNYTKKSKFLSAFVNFIRAEMIYPGITKKADGSIISAKRKTIAKLKIYGFITAIYLIALLIFIIDFNLWKKSNEIKNSLNKFSKMSGILISQNVFQNSKIFLNEKEFPNFNKIPYYPIYYRAFVEPGYYRINIKPNSSKYNDTLLIYTLDPGEFVYIDFSFSEKPPEIGIITGSNVILRSDHSIASDVVSRLNKGESVKILDRWTATDPSEAITIREVYLQTTAWTKILLNRGKAVKILSENNGYLTVSCEYQGRIVTGILPSDVVEKTYGQLWFKIQTNNGKTGWVFGKFLQERY